MPGVSAPTSRSADIPTPESDKMATATPPSITSLRARSPVEFPAAEFAAAQVAGLLSAYREALRQQCLDTVRDGRPV